MQIHEIKKKKYVPQIQVRVVYVLAKDELMQHGTSCDEKSPSRDGRPWTYTLHRFGSVRRNHPSKDRPRGPRKLKAPEERRLSLSYNKMMVKKAEERIRVGSVKSIIGVVIV